LIGHAELGWSRMDQRNWDYYRKRLAHHGMLLDMMGVNYYRSEKVGWLGSSE
jgi:hexosaminidase